MQTRFQVALAISLATLFLARGSVATAVEPSPFEFGYSEGFPSKINWLSESGRYYDLMSSENLVDWRPEDGFPRRGTGTAMEQLLKPAERQFYRMAASPNLPSFFLPEVAAYQATTGITVEAAGEINQFLRHLRGAGVEPVLFWVGGSRYNSITGSNARAVIGGTGTVFGNLSARGERYETFTGEQTLRFPNPLAQASQKRVGFFAGAAPALETGGGGLITGGESNPRGPRLATSWGGGIFQVYGSNGTPLNHAGYGGFAKGGAFLPYVGGVYDGYYSVLCGIGKSAGSRETPLQFYGIPPASFPENQFVNSQSYINLGSPSYSGRLHFAVATASDLTDNQRAYDIISIPRRSGFGSYGVQTAVVFLGDSITTGYNEHVWNSDGQNPPHKAGGQWNRNCLALLANATGEGNDAQIEYFNKGARYSLDSRTWDHLFYVCGSGGHYLRSEQVTQNPLTQEARESVDAWVREYHENIAVPASELGATVIQMTYVYGCPQNNSPSLDPEIYRTFIDYFVAKQREMAASAGFPILDVYSIPQLHEPIPAFYNDQIHPNAAGNRLIAQEFAATVANPVSRVPRSLGRPTISGTSRVGQVLTSSKGSWAFSPTVFSYQWMRDATDVPDATTSSYIVQIADSDMHLSCRITATNGYGSAERTSSHVSVTVP